MINMGFLAENLIPLLVLSFLLEIYLHGENDRSMHHFITVALGIPGLQ